MCNERDMRREKNENKKKIQNKQIKEGEAAAAAGDERAPRRARWLL